MEYYNYIFTDLAGNYTDDIFPFLSITCAARPDKENKSKSKCDDEQVRCTDEKETIIEMKNADFLVMIMNYYVCGTFSIANF